MKTKSGIKKKKKRFYMELLPFWVKKRCKFCGGKCVKEPQMHKEVKDVVDRTIVGKFVWEETFEETHLTPEYFCTNCHAVLTIDEVRKK
jgi:hypothetical protein